MLNNQTEIRRRKRENKVNMREILWKRMEVGFARGPGDYCHDSAAV